MRQIHALYWDNIDPAMVEGQRRVFEKLGYSIHQREETGKPHGMWIDEVMTACGPDDTVLLMDIDAFPLNREVVERAFAAAEDGRIFAVAQTAEHRPDRNLVYAAPAFMCLAKATWEAIGSPSFRNDAEADTGMRVSQAAIRHGVALELLYPSFVAIPRRRLGGKGCFGTATFYGEGSVFHLFEGRRIHNAGFQQLFDYIVERVLADQEVDYRELYRRTHAPWYRIKGIAYYFKRKGLLFQRRLGRRAVMAG